jgi:hypothetical protein
MITSRGEKKKENELGEKPVSEPRISCDVSSSVVLDMMHAERPLNLAFYN